MDATIKPINDKVSMFSTDEELYDKLTKQELILIKLVKAEEFLDDLYGAVLYPQTHKLFPPQDYYNKVKDLLKEIKIHQRK